MKKYISVLLAVVVLLALAVPAFASSIPTTGDTSVDVPATYTAGTVQIVGPDGNVSTATVYSVNVSWTGIEAIRYSGETKAYYWDAASHSYKISTGASEAAGWTKDSTSCTITITNHSNAEIRPVAEFTAASDIGATVTCTFTGSGEKIASAAPSLEQLKEGVVSGSAQVGTITAAISASGALNSGVTSVGSISITINPVG